MKKASSIIFVLIITLAANSQSKKKYPYNGELPTEAGIQFYIDLNKSLIKNTVENFIGDTIHSYNIKLDNLSEYQSSDSLEAGRFYPEDQIVISTGMKFDDYELSFMPKWKQKEYNYNTRFVRSVLIHEFIHLYIYQFIYESLENDIPINTEYINFSMFSRFGSHYTSEFMEEGVCEYVVMKLGEGIFPEYTIDCPGENNVTDFNRLIEEQNTNSIKYQYSRAYVQKIFDNNSFATALQVILTCKPPSFEELECPPQYYKRLMQHAEESGFENFSIPVI